MSPPRQGRKLAKLEGQNALKDARIADLQKFVDGKVLRKVFTWRASGWALDADAVSDRQLFCDGVSARCSLQSNAAGAERTHRLSLQFTKLQLRVGVVAAFSILDRNDEPIRSVNWGSAAAPFEGFSATQASSTISPKSTQTST